MGGNIAISASATANTMTLKFHPNPGTVLICDYQTGFLKPEMVKRRPVVVISPRLRRRDYLCTVVPLSTKQPSRIEPYHCKILFERSLPAPWDAPEVWAKCDMLATVSFGRLHLIGTKRDPLTGRRRYLQTKIGEEEFARIKKGIAAALGL